jgi:hypothetical protein
MHPPKSKSPLPGGIRIRQKIKRKTLDFIDRVAEKIGRVCSNGSESPTFVRSCVVMRCSEWLKMHGQE